MAKKSHEQKCLDEINAVCGKYGYALQAVPKINQNGTIGARIVMVKTKKLEVENADKVRKNKKNKKGAKG